MHSLEEHEKVRGQQRGQQREQHRRSSRTTSKFIPSFQLFRELSETECTDEFLQFVSSINRQIDPRVTQFTNYRKNSKRSMKRNKNNNNESNSDVDVDDDIDVDVDASEDSERSNDSNVSYDLFDEDQHEFVTQEHQHRKSSSSKFKQLRTKRNTTSFLPPQKRNNHSLNGVPPHNKHKTQQQQNVFNRNFSKGQFQQLQKIQQRTPSTISWSVSSLILNHFCFLQSCFDDNDDNDKTMEKNSTESNSKDKTTNATTTRTLFDPTPSKETKEDSASTEVKDDRARQLLFLEPEEQDIFTVLLYACDPNFRTKSAQERSKIVAKWKTKKVLPELPDVFVQKRYCLYGHRKEDISQVIMDSTVQSMHRGLIHYLGDLLQINILIFHNPNSSFSASLLPSHVEYSFGTPWNEQNKFNTVVLLRSGGQLGLLLLSNEIENKNENKHTNNLDDLSQEQRLLENSPRLCVDMEKLQQNYRVNNEWTLQKCVIDTENEKKMLARILKSEKINDLIHRAKDCGILMEKKPLKKELVDLLYRIYTSEEKI